MLICLTDAWGLFPGVELPLLSESGSVRCSLPSFVFIPNQLPPVTLPWAWRSCKVEKLRTDVAFCPPFIQLKTQLSQVLLLLGHLPGQRQWPTGTVQVATLKLLRGGWRQGCLHTKFLLFSFMEERFHVVLFVMPSTLSPSNPLRLSLSHLSILTWVSVVICTLNSNSTMYMELYIKLPSLPTFIKSQYKAAFISY